MKDIMKSIGLLLMCGPIAVILVIVFWISAEILDKLDSLDDATNIILGILQYLIIGGILWWIL